MSHCVPLVKAGSLGNLAAVSVSSGCTYSTPGVVARRDDTRASAAASPLTTCRPGMLVDWTVAPSVARVDRIAVEAPGSHCTTRGVVLRSVRGSRESRTTLRPLALRRSVLGSFFARNFIMEEIPWRSPAWPVATGHAGPGESMDERIVEFDLHTRRTIGHPG